MLYFKPVRLFRCFFCGDGDSYKYRIDNSESGQHITLCYNCSKLLEKNLAAMEAERDDDDRTVQRQVQFS